MAWRLRAARPRRPPVERWAAVDPTVADPLGRGGAERLAATYWRTARRAMAGVVRPEGDPLGPVALRVLASGGPALIRMGPALVERSADRVHVSFPILDGLAVAAPGGRLLLAAERAGPDVRVGVRVDGYTPRLYRPRALPARLLGVPYAAVQGHVHDRVTGRFLDALGGPS